MLIATTFRLYAEGLAEFLSRDPDWILTAISTSDAVLDALSKEPARVLLIDAAMPTSEQIIQRATRLKPQPAIIALALGSTSQEVLALAQAGASGFVSKEAGLADLRRVISEAVQGQPSCSPQVTRLLLEAVQQLAERAAVVQPARAASAPLTSREQEVAELLGAGLTNQEIADKLVVSISTVKNHVHNILGKLQVKRRGQAAAMLRSAGSW